MAGSTRSASPATPAGDAGGHRARFTVPFGDFLGQIANARSAGVYPLFPCFEELRGRHPRVDGVEQIVLTANDYLGLSTDPWVKEEAARALEEFGTSGCGSPLVTGYTHLHRALEERLAAFLRRDSAVLFPSGYQANVGALSALVGRGDRLLCDLYSHASILDGSQLSGATVQLFRHNDVAHLERLLGRREASGRCLVVVEGIYSVDGDLAPLPDILAVAHDHDALVLVDEAHSFGVLGDAGRGAAEHWDCLGDVDVLMGTMSKSLGSVGGFIVGDRDLVDYVRHSARALLFSAALPAVQARGAAAALGRLAGEPELRKALWQNTETLQQALRDRGLDTLGSATPVVPVAVGDTLGTAELTVRLREQGVLVCPVVPPMIPPHQSRLRLHATAAHTADELRRAAALIADTMRAMGLTPGGSRP